MLCMVLVQALQELFGDVAKVKSSNRKCISHGFEDG